MLPTLDQQQSQINLLQDYHTSSTRVIESRMGGIAVPAIVPPVKRFSSICSEIPTQIN
jgi:hypothetical protein